MRRSVLPISLLAVAAATSLSACSKDDASGATTEVEVVNTDTACQVSKTTVGAGKTKFEVKNQGNKVTEVYVYGTNDKIITEKENIGPGTTAEFTATLGGGTYQVACKPGQTGDGIRQTLTVTGAPAAADDGKYDREVEIEAKEFGFEGLSGFTAKVGERIEFKLENKGTTEHEWKLLDPSGEQVAEIEHVAAGKDGEIVVEFKKAGTYTFQCPIDGHAGKGMKGSFTVTA